MSTDVYEEILGCESVLPFIGMRRHSFFIMKFVEIYGFNAL